jgi:hypothetical protein
MYYTNTHSVCSHRADTYTRDICEYALFTFINKSLTPCVRALLEKLHTIKARMFMHLVLEVTRNNLYFKVDNREANNSLVSGNNTRKWKKF